VLNDMSGLNSSKFGGHPSPTYDKRLPSLISIWILLLSIVIAVSYCISRSKVLPRLKSKLQSANVESLGLRLLACGAFLVVGPCLMMLNKHIMQKLHFPYPLSLSSLGLLGSCFISRSLVYSKLVVIQPETREWAENIGFQTLLPIGVLRAATLATGNAVYLHLGLGFIQMVKAITPAIVLLVSLAAPVKSPSRPAGACVAFIVLGTFFDIKGELNASTLGLLLMFSSCFFEAVSLVLSQVVLQKHKLTVVESMYYISPYGALPLLTMAVVTEWKTMFAAGDHLAMLKHPLEFIMATLLGVGVNFCTTLVLSLSSAVTLKVLNTVRCVAVVIIGTYFYGEVRSLTQIAGYSVSLSGFVGYNFFISSQKHSECIDVAITSAMAVCMPCCSSQEERRKGIPAPLSELPLPDADVEAIVSKPPPSCSLCGQVSPLTP